jgi:hypothetical protein
MSADHTWSGFQLQRMARPAVSDRQMPSSCSLESVRAVRHGHVCVTGDLPSGEFAREARSERPQDSQVPDIVEYVFERAVEPHVSLTRHMSRLPSYVDLDLSDREQVPSHAPQFPARGLGGVPWSGGRPPRRSEAGLSPWLATVPVGTVKRGSDCCHATSPPRTGFESSPRWASSGSILGPTSQPGRRSPDSASPRMPSTLDHPGVAGYRFLGVGLPLQL